MQSQNELVRYWGAIGFGARKGELSEKAGLALGKALKDSSPSVRIEAANALAHQDEIGLALPVLIKELEHKNLIVVTHAARTIELLGTKAKDAIPAMQACLKRAHKIRPPDLSPVIVLPGDEDMAMFVGFSCQAFLDNLQGQTIGGRHDKSLLCLRTASNEDGRVGHRGRTHPRIDKLLVRCQRQKPDFQRTDFRCPSFLRSLRGTGSGVLPPGGLSRKAERLPGLVFIIPARLTFRSGS